MWINLAVAAAYFYFNWRYFALANMAGQRPKYAGLRMMGAFFLNYGMFYLCSVMEWNLLINWGLFFLVQFGETLLYCRRGWRVPLYLSLNGILYGLTVNIFCRCAVAILLAKPLSAFDNHTTAYGNVKGLPVFLGFILGGAVLQYMSTKRSMEKLQVLIEHPKHLNFQLELLGGMFLYLFLNLLLYQSGGNNVILKLWGIKSAAFSLVGACLGLRYALKMCELSDYREQNRRIRKKIIQSEEEEERLSAMAYRDMLTGMFNRQYILDKLEQMIQEHARFTLCFLDLDDLKGVNDRYGHAEGDRYLAAAARELTSVCRRGMDIPARYGGDEFLILFPGASVSAVEERIQRVELRLAELSRREDYPFNLSLSHGTVDGSGAVHVEMLLAAADERMYREKRKKINTQENDAMPDISTLTEEIRRLKEELRRSREYDPLTGLYNKNSFFENAVRLLDAHPEEAFDIACVDVERFKLVNDIYGTEAGDQLLQGIARKLKETFASEKCVMARMFNDTFALLLPAGQQQEAEQSVVGIFRELSRDMVLTPAIGFCPVVDRSHGVQGISSMYDRAILALKSVKGNYLKHAAAYDVGQFSLLLEEQELLNDVGPAMENHEFELYMQPKCNMHTSKIIGAEVLVRWRHPKKGLIPPGVFIPLFERNGFIKHLDVYVWEEAARWLRRWIDKGRKPFPISVNLSRVDIFAMDVCGILSGIMQKYRLDVSLLELEITESAYVNQPETVIHTMERLTARKFTLLMDDFGSGYSSLNMLSSVNVDILKIDMKFLVRNDQKSRDILGSVLHMSKWLDLPVIAEGVEDQWQVDFLMDMGCIYAQGYYYYHPMPLADFEKLLLKEDKVDYRDNGMLRVSREMLLDFHELFHRDVMSDRLLENVLGAIALFRLEGGRLFLSKATEEYYRLTGRLGVLSAGQGMESDLLDALREEDRLDLLETLHRAKSAPNESGAEVCICRETPPPVRWFKIRLFHLAARADGDIFYGALADVTSQMENIERLRVREKQFYLAMEATNIVLFELDLKTREARYSEYAQKAFNLEEAVANAPDGFIEQGTVCDESQDDFRAIYETIYAGGERASCIIHAKLGDGSLVWNRITLVAVRDEQGKAGSAVGMVETVSRAPDFHLGT